MSTVIVMEDNGTKNGTLVFALAISALAGLAGKTLLRFTFGNDAKFDVQHTDSGEEIPLNNVANLVTIINASDNHMWATLSTDFLLVSVNVANCDLSTVSVVTDELGTSQKQWFATLVNYNPAVINNEVVGNYTPPGKKQPRNGLATFLSGVIVGVVAAQILEPKVPERLY